MEKTKIEQVQPDQAAKKIVEISLSDSPQKKKPAKKRWDNSYPYKEKMKRAEYEKLKIELQIELLKVQSWVRESGEKICLLFEGRDAAGKGGTIKRMMEHLNPRTARVVALEKPSDRERGQWYFQRYTFRT